ncbi:hypothetical protein [Paenibacillus xerothermodurans]|uniref:hypothetical protein n=1 Tax=Paenibacillus xerothermodurans TaxID=1977292 RepID=UPI001057FC15|nr:hypothetical protein [Paenibacillus xerothermodurans]
MNPAIIQTGPPSQGGPVCLLSLQACDTGRAATRTRGSGAGRRSQACAQLQAWGYSRPHAQLPAGAAARRMRQLQAWATAGRMRQLQAWATAGRMRSCRRGPQPG